MAKAIAKLTTKKPLVPQLAEGLGELEESLLRVRGLVYGARMAACSPELTNDARSRPYSAC
jgi:hypothetical protein